MYRLQLAYQEQNNLTEIWAVVQKTQSVLLVLPNELPAKWANRNQSSSEEYKNIQSFYNIVFIMSKIYF